jgi:hypothetical protein
MGAMMIAPTGSISPIIMDTKMSRSRKRVPMGIIHLAVIPDIIIMDLKDIIPVLGETIFRTDRDDALWMALP